jgi:hypothetical protein
MKREPSLQPKVTLLNIYDDVYVEERTHWKEILDKQTFKKAMSLIFQKMQLLMINEQFSFKLPVIGGEYTILSRKMDMIQIDAYKMQGAKKEAIKEMMGDVPMYFFYFRRRNCKNWRFKQFYKVRVSNTKDEKTGKKGLHEWAMNTILKD